MFNGGFVEAFFLSGRRWDGGARVTCAGAWGPAKPERGGTDLGGKGIRRDEATEGPTGLGERFVQENP